MSFYNGKRVLITGHTGFKGSWLCAMLLQLGAEVYGYSHQTYPFYEMADLKQYVKSSFDDIRNVKALQNYINLVQPEIIFHLAAQPLVIQSYQTPRETYEVNVMGTVNLLDSARQCTSVKAIVNVTTDKVYQNNEWHWGYRESDQLNGQDPYSNSKSCSELVTASYQKSFFCSSDSAFVGTARAGNVIGGGDFSENRIIPDCIRAVKSNKSIIVRNQLSIRPWQHVLEPLCGYLKLAKMLYLKKISDFSFNFGPPESDCIDVGTLVSKFCEIWGEGASWEHIPDQNAPHEATFLKLDCSKAQNILKWRPILNIYDAITLSVEWQKQIDLGVNAFSQMNHQINNYFQKRKGFFQGD